MVGLQSLNSGNSIDFRLRKPPDDGAADGRVRYTAGAKTESRLSATSTSSPALTQTNFLAAGLNESKYQKARKAGNSAVQNQATRQMAVLSAGLAELNSLSEKDANNYAIRAHIGRKAARRMLQEKQKSSSEVSERNLDEIKDENERRAQEAVSPKDFEGNPVDITKDTGRGTHTPYRVVAFSPLPEAATDSPTEYGRAIQSYESAMTAPSLPTVDSFV